MALNPKVPSFQVEGEDAFASCFSFGGMKTAASVFLYVSFFFFLWGGGGGWEKRGRGWGVEGSSLRALLPSVI